MLLVIVLQEMQRHKQAFANILNSGGPGVRIQQHLLMGDGQRRIA